MAGRVLDGKYEVQQCLEEGGMGAVYVAQHRVIGRRVAVKFLLSRFAKNPQALTRFHREAQIAGSLGHDNICEVTDVGQTEDGLPYMVMPLLSGRTLAREIRDHQGRLSTERVFDIVSQVLLALQAAHEAGVVHRDLKPENIFLTRVGDREDFVKVLDFGISKVVDAAAPDLGGLTSTGMVVGTPHYMSPEQAQGAKDVDHRVDIYATGVLLYELLTGEHPFEADSYNALILKIVTEPLRPPRSLNPDIKPPLEKVILRAMHRDPGQRWESAARFRSVLLRRARQTGIGLPSYLTQVDEQVGGEGGAFGASPVRAAPAFAPVEPASAGNAGDPASAGPLPAPADPLPAPADPLPAPADPLPAPAAPADGQGDGAWMATEGEPSSARLAHLSGPAADPERSGTDPGAKVPGVYRRFRVWAGLVLAAAAVGTVAGALVLWDPDDSTSRDQPALGSAPALDGSVSPREDGSSETQKAKDAPNTNTVSIQFLGLPRHGRIELSGKPLAGNTATVTRSDVPLRFRAHAPDHGTVTDTVTPDQDRMVLLAFPGAPTRARVRPARTTTRPMAGGMRSATGSTGRRVHASRPRARRPRRAARHAPRRRAVIRGRHGTYLKGDYDND